MKFGIDFNRKEQLPDFDKRNQILKDLGATTEHSDMESYPVIEVKSLEHLEQLWKKLTELTGEIDNYYSFVISFDSPTIFLDKDI